MISARIERQPPAQTVPFPETRSGHRGTRVPWVGLVAAAAAAALFFAWSWQRLLPVNAPEHTLVSSAAAPTVEMAAADGGSMDTWMREHAMLARGGTLLGPAEEIESATLHASAVPER
jgi:hypothetical protein